MPQLVFYFQSFKYVSQVKIKPKLYIFPFHESYYINIISNSLKDVFHGPTLAPAAPGCPEGPGPPAAPLLPAGPGGPSAPRGPCDMVWYGVIWCGVVWCGVVWCGVVWCGVMWFDGVVGVV